MVARLDKVCVAARPLVVGIDQTRETHATPQGLDVAVHVADSHDTVGGGEEGLHLGEGAGGVRGGKTREDWGEGRWE